MFITLFLFFHLFESCELKFYLGKNEDCSPRDRSEKLLPVVGMVLNHANHIMSEFSCKSLQVRRGAGRVGLSNNHTKTPRGKLLNAC